MSDDALQPPSGGEEQEEPQDSVSVEPLIPEPGPGVPPPVVPPPPAIFALPDTTTRHDSVPAFPQSSAAPVETIGPRTVVPSLPARGGAAAQPTAPEKTLFGLTPLAIVAGLIALHIVVVSMVVK